MTCNELYTSVMQNISVTAIHPLHKAVLEECCENALANEQGVTDEATLRYAVNVAFLTALQVLQGVLRSALETAQADQVTLEYRGHTFTIPASSTLLSQNE